MKKFISFLILNYIFATDFFFTEIGSCTLNIYEGKQIKNHNLQHLIIDNLLKLSNEFGIVEKKSFQIFITNELTEFNRLSSGPIPEWGIAVAKSNPSRIIIKGPKLSNISYSRLKQVLIHELYHLYFFRKKGNTYVPSWFSEGLASNWAKEFDLNKKILISSALWNKKIFPLFKLKEFNQFNRQNAHLAYAQSSAAIDAIRFFYQDSILINLVNNLKYITDFDSLFIDLTKDNQAEFLIKYENFLNENYRWMFLLKTSNLIFIIMPLLVIIGYLIKRRHNKITIKNWEKEETIIDNYI